MTVIPLLAACGGGGSSNSNSTTSTMRVQVDPAALYCESVGGEVMNRVVNRRRADLCRLPSGRTVRAADLLNNANDL
ncbi:DUF333 domain-containing protein [Paracoccus sp. SCSIO 75233]|uniref:DUF333 domain-containing protein n=1 Tax=Paracoccus sp. SCSIO 75233 TaxID=3017782 RepID=UPI0022F03E78|nr:DUF333 domain-containing protein [Paracoccus sp. SCSIO 75233]WBU53544.1 DUF333 domain-containing protein [Paracoccus sp. SCSIO 75233]